MVVGELATPPTAAAIHELDTAAAAQATPIAGLQDTPPAAEQKRLAPAPLSKPVSWSAASVVVIATEVCSACSDNGGSS